MVLVLVQVPSCERTGPKKELKEADVVFFVSGLLCSFVEETLFFHDDTPDDSELFVVLFLFIDSRVCLLFAQVTPQQLVSCVAVN